jgi:membrane protease YdiL (CAAX protease family)
VVVVIAFKTICFLLFSALPPEIQGASVAEWSDRWSFPLYALTAISVVPITEEVTIRGFLFKGFQNSKLGDLGAVICTAILFAFAHREFSHVLILGLLLGFARLHTKSLYVPIAMHALANYFTWVVSENFYH